MRSRHLLLLSGVFAWIGACLWLYKGVSILATEIQPDHAFEVAPFFFGLSAITLTYALIGDIERRRLLVLVLAWAAVTAGAVAALAHFADRSDDFGDLGYLINFVSMTILFFVISGDIRRKSLLPRFSWIPTLLAWALLLIMPVGAIFEGFGERFLEIPLVAVSGIWVMLGVAVTSRPTVLGELD